MIAFETYKLWTALYLHFKTDYDYIKYNGKTKISQKSFDYHHNKGVFYKLARKYNDEQIMDYFLANFLYEDNVWESKLLTPEYDLNFKQYTKNKQSLFNVFSNDIQKLADLCEINNKTFAELFIYHKGANHYPQIMVYTQFGEITLETFIILDLFLKFTDKWSENFIDDQFWQAYKKRCDSFKPFLEKALNKTKFKLKLRQIFGTTESV